MKVIAGKHEGHDIKRDKEKLYLNLENPAYERYMKSLPEDKRLDHEYKEVAMYFPFVTWAFLYFGVPLIFSVQIITPGWAWILFFIAVILFFIIKPSDANCPSKHLIRSLDSTTIAGVEEINEHNRQSFMDSYANAWLGSKFLGNAGMIAGAMAGATISTHLVAITWKNGERSLAQLDGDAYRLLLQVTFK